MGKSGGRIYDFPHWGCPNLLTDHIWRPNRLGVLGEGMTGTSLVGDPFCILIVTQGRWGDRIASNIRTHAPADWTVETWGAPLRLPPVVDDPDEFIPARLPAAHLVLCLGEVPGLAQLLPDLVRRSGARAVIAPIDHTASLPPGLQRQVQVWLDEMGVPIAFPKPFCTLTGAGFNVRPLTSDYDDPFLRRFAAAFGRPEFRIEIERGRVARVEVLRDSACGCARHVAAQLTGTPVDDAIEKAGMFHHHYPCLAGMDQDPDYRDTLMHVSGHQVRDAVRAEIEDHLAPVAYLRPEGLSE